MQYYFVQRVETLIIDEDDDDYLMKMALLHDGCDDDEMD